MIFTILINFLAYVIYFLSAILPTGNLPAEVVAPIQGFANLAGGVNWLLPVSDTFSALEIGAYVELAIITWFGIRFLINR